VVVYLILVFSLNTHGFLRIRPESLNYLTYDKTKIFEYNIYEPTTFEKLTHNEFEVLLSEKYQTWHDAVKKEIDYKYLGLTTKELTFVENQQSEFTDTDGIHTHRVVVENWRRDLGLSTSAVAITLLYNNEERIHDVDVVYNEENFSFCTEIESCRDGEIHLPSIILHEQGHQIGFDHTTILPSIMETSIPFKTERSLETTDKAGAVCAYAKNQVSDSQFVSACSHAEGEGGLAQSRSWLTSQPRKRQTTGCGSMTPFSGGTFGGGGPSLLLAQLFSILGMIIFLGRRYGIVYQSRHTKLL
jgi:hypothetical protein